MIKRKALISLSLLSSVGMGAANAQQADSRPNIILFMVDDMGWQDTSLPFWKETTPFNKRFQTPNMERLASEGMQFTQAYACSVSSPSRVSLLTGMNAARHRVTNWTLRKDKSQDTHSDLLDFPVWNMNGICEEGGIPHTYQVTPLPRLLKNSGYYTIHCGKAHWGAMGTPGESPLNLGFDINIAGHAAGGPASYLGKDNFGNRTDGKESSPFAIPGLEEYWGSDTFATEALTLEAKKALDRAKALNKPFFLHMSHYAIHVPINKDLRFYQKYIELGFSEKEAAYAALVEGMDKSLGDLMEWLEENKMQDNTIILFMSDNGGLAASDYWRDPPMHIQNAPLRSGKGSAYEGGIREPMIVKWSGKVAPGSKCDDYLIIEDFFPTLLDMANVKERKTVQPIDGVSFIPLLEGKRGSKSRPLFWHYPNRWDAEGPGIGTTSSIRLGDWKLIYYYESGKKELYNITKDISETNELSAENPRMVKRLSKELSNHLRRVQAQLPSFKGSGKLCPLPDEIR